MALVRTAYDMLFFVYFCVTSVFMYFQHHSYDYSTHPWTVITCKIGAIIMTILSINLFFSCYTNNYVQIIHMKELGPDRYLEMEEETTDNEQGNDKDPSISENAENTQVDDAENEGAASEETPRLDNGGKANGANEENKVDPIQRAAIPNVEEIGPART